MAQCKLGTIIGPPSTTNQNNNKTTRSPSGVPLQALIESEINLEYFGPDVYPTSVKFVYTKHDRHHPTWESIKPVREAQPFGYDRNFRLCFPRPIDCLDEYHGAQNVKKTTGFLFPKQKEAEAKELATQWEKSKSKWFNVKNEQKINSLEDGASEILNEGLQIEIVSGCSQVEQTSNTNELSF
ncbi:hypothetical protein QTP88_020375 [Uroleucon formosanum]